MVFDPIPWHNLGEISAGSDSNTTTNTTAVASGNAGAGPVVAEQATNPATEDR